jgi:hypothetical protein
MPDSSQDHSTWLYLQDCENVSLVRNLPHQNTRRPDDMEDAAEKTRKGSEEQ